MIGTLLILLLVVSFAVVVAAGAFGICGSKSFLAGGLDPVGACIEIELAEGGLTCIGTKSVSFDENRIILVHRGGTPLALESTSILITGYGNAYNGSVANGDQAIKGETFVTYADLTPAGKNKKYLKNNQQMLEDEVWTAGERLILNGKNSPKKGEYSSVSVKVNETENTTDNYAFKAGSEITVTLIDRDRRVRLAKEKAIVNYPPLK